MTVFVVFLMSACTVTYWPQGSVELEQADRYKSSVSNLTLECEASKFLWKTNYGKCNVKIFDDKSVILEQKKFAIYGFGNTQSFELRDKDADFQYDFSPSEERLDLLQTTQSKKQTVRIQCRHHFVGVK